MLKKIKKTKKIQKKSCINGLSVVLYMSADENSAKKENENDAPIAQLDRAFDYGSKGCGFDSCWARHLFRDVAQLGSALDLGSRGRRFESCHPDHDLNLWRGSLVG